jgi:hypothetical protein
MRVLNRGVLQAQHATLRSGAAWPETQGTRPVLAVPDVRRLAAE